MAATGALMTGDTQKAAGDAVANGAAAAAASSRVARRSGRMAGCARIKRRGLVPKVVCCHPPRKTNPVETRSRGSQGAKLKKRGGHGKGGGQVLRRRERERERRALKSRRRSGRAVCRRATRNSNNLLHIPSIQSPSAITNPTPPPRSTPLPLGRQWARRRARRRLMPPSATSPPPRRLCRRRKRTKRRRPLALAHGAHTQQAARQRLARGEH